MARAMTDMLLVGDKEADFHATLPLNLDRQPIEPHDPFPCQPIGEPSTHLLAVARAGTRTRARKGGSDFSKRARKPLRGRPCFNPSYDFHLVDQVASAASTVGRAGLSPASASAARMRTSSSRMPWSAVRCATPARARPRAANRSDHGSGSVRV